MPTLLSSGVWSEGQCWSFFEQKVRQDLKDGTVLFLDSCRAALSRQLAGTLQRNRCGTCQRLLTLSGHDHQSAAQPRAGNAGFS
eukprot:m.189652 g.189652  ORF g.189652 m.189652 type:complete len:84 (-) comp21678_c1_seq1:82-333(-)